MKLLLAALVFVMQDISFLEGSVPIEVTLDSVTDTSANMSVTIGFLTPGVDETLEVINYDCIDAVGGTAVVCIGTVIETFPGVLGPGATPATVYWSSLSPATKYAFRVNNMQLDGANRTGDSVGDIELCTTGQLPPSGMTLTEGVGSSVNVTLSNPTSGQSDGFKVTYSVWDTTNSNWTLRGDRNLTTTAGTLANEVDINLTPVGSLYRIVAEAVDPCGNGLSEENVTDFFESRIPAVPLTLAFIGSKLVCVYYQPFPAVSWTRMNLVKNGNQIGTQFDQPNLLFPCAEVDDPNVIGLEDSIEVQLYMGTNLTVEGVEYSLTSNVVTETYNLNSTMLFKDLNISCSGDACSVGFTIGNDVSSVTPNFNISWTECDSTANMFLASFGNICTLQSTDWVCAYSISGYTTEPGISFQIQAYSSDGKWADISFDVGDCSSGSGSGSGSGAEIVRGTVAGVYLMVACVLIAAVQ